MLRYTYIVSTFWLFPWAFLSTITHVHSCISKTSSVWLLSMQIRGLFSLPVFSFLFNHNNNLRFVLERLLLKRRQYTLNLNAPVIHKEDPHFEPPWKPEIVYNLISLSYLFFIPFVCPLRHLSYLPSLLVYVMAAHSSVMPFTVRKVAHLIHGISLSWEADSRVDVQWISRIL